MWSKREYPSMEALSKHIGQNVGKMLPNALNFNLIFFNKKGILKIEYTLANGNKKYLLLFIYEDKESYRIHAIKKIIDDKYLFLIPEELKEEVFSTENNLFSYGNCYIVLSKQELNTNQELYSNISDNDNYIIDESVISAYTKITNIVSEYEEIRKFQNSSEINSLNQNEKNYFMSLDFRKCLVEKIAHCCQKTLFFYENNIIINEFPTEYKIQIVLSRNDEKKVLYVIFDKNTSNLFFMRNKNGVWNKELLPDTIEKVAQCFL